MSKIENAKTYLGKELETIFFRPLFADEGARELGIKVMYNMPAPTRLHFWHRPDDVLHKYTSAGWNGSASAERYTKTIELHRVKAEMSYSADEYFSLVYDSLAQSALTQLDDLTDAPVDYQDYASEAEELADLTADNRIAELATTDNKMLAEVFADIDTGEIPFMLSGYTEDDYGNIVTALSEALHTKEPSSDPDAEIPAPAAPVTQYGDLWILGRHRVLCGDCTRPEDRALLLDGNKPEILLTDPPYCSGGSKESQKSTGSIGTERKNGKAPKIANDILSTRGYQNLIRGALTDIPCLYAYIFTDWRMWVYLFDLVEAAGFGVKSEIVWDKGTPGMGVGWRSQHELILFGAKAATHFDGHKGYGNVLSISRSGNELHPTQKPVELLEKLVDNTDFATGVYDPFGGSGTTLAACEAYGQPSYIMELTPAFTDVIVKRYIRITGKTTVRCVRQGRELPREEIAAIFEPDEEGGEQE